LQHKILKNLKADKGIFINKYIDNDINIKYFGECFSL
jgi:3-methyladenine DNA glycosylase AlkC